MTGIDNSRVDLWSLEDGARKVEYALTNLPGSNDTYTLEPYVTQARTLKQVVYYCESGSCTLTFNQNGSGITGLTSLSVGTSAVVATATGDGVAFDVGDTLKAVVTSATDLVDLHIKAVFEVDKDA